MARWMILLALPAVAGILHSVTTQLPAAAAPATLKFEVASIKPAINCHPSGPGEPPNGISASPGRLSIRCQTVDGLIRRAYLANGREPVTMSIQRYLQPIKGSPPWINSERYTVEAKTGANAEVVPSREMMLGRMLQALLEDRFKLKTHLETREVPVYELTVAKGGLKIEAAKDEKCKPLDVEFVRYTPAGTHTCGVLMRSVNPAVPAALDGATMTDLGNNLSSRLDRDVMDKTGIAGMFDFRLELSQCDQFPVTCTSRSSDPDALPSASVPQGASIFQSLQKLGLKLESAKAPAEFLVIDHVERPSEN
jgi:uncharacterized protein (TIGR03435 family)